MTFYPEESFDIRVQFFRFGREEDEYSLPLRELVRDLGLTPQVMRELAVTKRRSPDNPDDYPVVPHPDDLADHLEDLARDSSTIREAQTAMLSVIMEVLREMGYGRAVNIFAHPERIAQYAVYP